MSRQPYSLAWCCLDLTIVFDQNLQDIGIGRSLRTLHLKINPKGPSTQIVGSCKVQKPLRVWILRPKTLLFGYSDPLGNAKPPQQRPKAFNTAVTSEPGRFLTGGDKSLDSCFPYSGSPFLERWISALGLLVLMPVPPPPPPHNLNP